MSDTINKNYAGTIILKCANCGGHLEVDKDNDTARCPYCGTSELLIESDGVVIERIRNKTLKDVASEKIQADKELELTRLLFQTQEETQKKFAKIRKSPFTVIIAILTIVSLFMAVATYFWENYLISAIFIGFQSLSFFVAWLIRMRLIKGAGVHLHSLFSLLAILLIIPCFMFIGVEYKNYDLYIWQDGNLASMLPKPQSDYGEIKSDHIDYFHMTVGRIRLNDYTAYVEECIEKGFSLKPFRTEDTYYAYHENGTELSIHYFSDLKAMEITVKGFGEFYEFVWSGRGISALLPEPVSKLGIIDEESEESFNITVAETSYSEYNKYVDACIEAGFSVDILKLEDIFYSENIDGLRIKITYNISDVMEISVFVPLPPE